MRPDMTTLELEDSTKCLLWMEHEIKEDNFNYTCYLTDLVNVYIEDLDKEAFMKRFNDLNEDLEVENYEEVLTELGRILQLSTGYKKRAKMFADGICEVNVDWVSEDIPYKWRFILRRGSSQQFNSQVFCQVFDCMYKLAQEKKTLLEVVRKKDLEIEDYETSGARLSRKSLKTGRFNEAEALKDTDTINDGPPDKVDFVSHPEFTELLKRSNLTVKTTASKNQYNGTNDNGTSSTTDATEKKRKYVKPNLFKISKNNRDNSKKPKLNI